MRNLLTAFIIGILCMQAHARGTSTSSGDEPLETVVKLSFGTYAGECIGYCVKELNIQIAEGLEDVFAQKVRYSWDRNDPAYPPRFTGKILGITEYQRLLNVTNLPAFQALRPKYGCPDCADGGAVWIALTSSKGLTYRVEFDDITDILASGFSETAYYNSILPLHDSLRTLFNEL